MKKLGLFVMAILVLLAGLYGGFHYMASPEAPKTPEMITIGWIGPLTGIAKLLGVDNLNAVKLAVYEYESNKDPNDPKINLLVVDDEYNAERAVAAYKKMAARSDKPLAIFMSTYSGVKIIAKDALKDSIIIINPIDNDLELARLNVPWKANLFLIGKETEGLAALDAYAIIDDNKQNTVVIYYSGDDFMPTLAKTLEKILKNKGKQVKLFGYSTKDADYTESLTWGKLHRADSYVFFGYPEVGVAMKQARAMGITAPFYAANSAFQETSGGAVKNTFFSHFTRLDGNRLLANKFMQRYWQHYKRNPTLEWTALQAYDAGTILLHVIKEAVKEQGNFNENVRNNLQHLSGYPGVSGTISIKPNGASLGIYPSLYIIEDGKVTPYIKK